MAAERKPKMIVFDLDWTLWPFHMELDVDLPLKKKGDRVVDQSGRAIQHFPAVPSVLERLTSEGYVLAAASRTTRPDGAEQLLQMWGWDQFFAHKEIYPGSKKTHFRKIQQASGFEYAEMLFFDDDMRNIRDSTAIGVTAFYVESEMTHDMVDTGLRKFATAKK